MVALIFALWFLLSSSIFFPRLISAVVDWMSAKLPHMHGMALVRSSDASLKRAARGWLEMQYAKKSPKIAIWAPSYNFVGLYLRNYGTYRQSEKKLVKQQYVLQMSPQCDELRPTSG